MENNVSATPATLILLLIPALLTIFMIVSLGRVKNKNQLHKIFLIVFVLLFFWFLGLILQITLSAKLNINPIYFEYFIYISACFTPVFIFFLALIFTNTKISFKRIYILLFIVPIISLLVLWTNDSHHLFYKYYSISMEFSEFGPYMSVYSIYSYSLVFVACFMLINYSIKNSGFFSKQSLLIFVGTLTPVLVNISGYIGLVNLNVYSTPISFTIGILCFALAAFKLQFLNTTPIALQKIVDRISDGYIIINEYSSIIDYNKTFLTMLKIKKDIRNINIKTLLSTNNNSAEILKILDQNITKIKNDPSKTLITDIFEPALNKYFSIEVSCILSNDNILGILILFKDTTQHVLDLNTIKDNQQTLMEKERLASLGQLIGGIAHNLKTPIMSISGAAEGLDDLIKEYNASIDDPEVNSQDHHDIAKDMSSWVMKIRDYTGYMSDIITAVKGQAVNLANEEDVNFTISELLKRVDILMKHELKNALIYLKVNVNDNENISLNGDINSLVQVINNMISNAIQAYDGKTEENIYLTVAKNSTHVVISIKDEAGGLPKKVQEKLFKEMITTKGKNGTGLGLYMSYSTIRGNFNGDITFDVETGKSTTFNIILPL